MLEAFDQQIVLLPIVVLIEEEQRARGVAMGSLHCVLRVLAATPLILPVHGTCPLYCP